MDVLLKRIFINLYLMLRGRTHVTSSMTGKVYSHSHVQESKDGERVIHLKSFQYVHDIFYTSWLVPWNRRRLYTYEVMAHIRETDGSTAVLPPYNYPHLCSRLLSKSLYPHICAINACLDVVIRTNR